jgi:hypothetical protein
MPDFLRDFERYAEFAAKDIDDIETYHQLLVALGSPFASRLKSAYATSAVAADSGTFHYTWQWAKKTLTNLQGVVDIDALLPASEAAASTRTSNSNPRRSPQVFTTPALDGKTPTRVPLQCSWCHKDGHRFGQCRSRQAGRPCHPNSKHADHAPGPNGGDSATARSCSHHPECAIKIGNNAIPTPISRKLTEQV